MPAAVVLFAKAPRPGRVKTRLTPPLTAAQAAEFHRACVHDTWRKIESLATASHYLYSDTAWDDYEGLARPEQRGTQKGEHLGARMFNCFRDLHDLGHDRVLILGSDSPTLPVEYIEQGLRTLEEVDAVLGLCEDGGYYAIGCREAHPGMFTDVTWSSPETRRQTES
ncbi:MAG TPA: TIGR04282 family arsenosugar biosynthesis glycosyltransferase, partial [Anaerolineales bacterium]